MTASERYLRGGIDCPPIPVLRVIEFKSKLAAEQGDLTLLDLQVELANGYAEPLSTPSEPLRPHREVRRGCFRRRYRRTH